MKKTQPIGVEDMFPITNREIKLIMAGGGYVSEYYIWRKSSRLLSICNKCFEPNFVISIYDGDGDTCFAEEYKCDKCHEELRYFKNDVTKEYLEKHFITLQMKYNKILAEAVNEFTEIEK